MKKIDGLLLWKKLEDIPVDDNDCIEEEFEHFPVGSEKFEIWHWFENYFDIKVKDLVYAQKEAMELEIEYQHGNKYTKKWIGFAKRTSGGGFSLEHDYNGGRFKSQKDILSCIENLKKEGYTIKSVKDVTRK
ncbi:MAG: hypothetical protein M0R03_20715 [Novosphingobium sp.]|nr:hypothetical protein [Novosphingobium sp.]